MRAAPDPRILTGWSGASPHVLRFPPRAFLRFPVCPPGSPPSPAFLRFPVVRRSPVRPLRPSPRFRFPLSVSLRVPLPLGNLHDSAAAGRFRRLWSRAARAKVTSPAATLPFLDLAVIRPAPQAGSGRAQWMPLQNRLLRAAASAGHRRARTAQIRRISHDSRGQRSSRSATDVPERERTERRIFAAELLPGCSVRGAQIVQFGGCEVCAALAFHTTVLRAMGVLTARSASPRASRSRWSRSPAHRGSFWAGFHEVLVDGQDRFWQQCRFVTGYSRTGRRE